MELMISGRGVALTRAFKDAATGKLARLAPLLPTLTGARATCRAEKFRRTVRLTLRARRHVFSSEATATDLMTAVDEAVASLAHQVRRAKERARLGPRRLRRAGARRAGREVA